MNEVEFRNRVFPVYTEQEARESGIEFNEDWRDGAAGEYVRTDTGYVLEVLKAGQAGETPWIRTPCGTYPARSGDRLEHTPRLNRYTFSGRDPVYSVTKRMEIFAKVYARTGDAGAAYRYAYPTATNGTYIGRRSRFLLNLPAVKSVVNNELDKVLTEIRVSRGWSAKEAKELYDLLKSEDGMEPPTDDNGKYLYQPQTMQNRALRLRLMQFLDRLAEERDATQGSAEVTEEQTFNMSAQAADALERGEGESLEPEKHKVTVKRKVRVDMKNGVQADDFSGRDTSPKQT